MPPPPQLDYGPVITLLVLYFLLSVWSVGMAQASGLMVPSLLIGGRGVSLTKLMLHGFMAANLCCFLLWLL